MGVLSITDDSQYHSQLAYNGNRLVVVDFTAAWCGQCLRMYPVFEKLSTAFPKAVFLKVDVDICRDTAKAQGLPSVPTFIFYRNRVQIDRVSGGDQQLLEGKIRQYYGAETDLVDELPPEGHMDLLPFIKGCEVLNASPKHQLINCLTAGDTFLESLSDKQLIFSIYFSQAVKIHSLRFKAPSTNGPKIVKLFINQPNTLGFDEAENNIPTQTLEINCMKLASGYTMMLQFVKFQNVQNLHLFIEDNHDDSEITCINYLQLFGSPISTTNMKNLNSGVVKKS